MSDQTPNSSDNLNGSEPSMEDILASIRKIISDDEPVAMDSPEDFVSDAVLDTAETVQSAVAGADFHGAEPESVDLNIDEVLAGLEEDVLAPETETPIIDSVVEISDSEMADDDAFSNVFDDVLANDTNDDTLEMASSQPAAEDDILSLLDGDISLEKDPATALTPELVSDASFEAPMADEELEIEASEIEALGDEEPDDIDALLNDLLGEEDPLPIEIPIEDVALDVEDLELDVEDLALDVEDLDLDVEDLDLDVEDMALDVEDLDLDVDETSVAELADLNTEPTGVGETEDLELVKSLMADLSDDSATIDTVSLDTGEDLLDETGEDLESLLLIPDADDAAAEVSAVEAEVEDDILGEILDITLEDELKTHPEDLAALEDLIAEDAVSETAESDPLASLEDVLEAEQENIAENAQIAEDDIGANDFTTLSEIAEAAEADAIAVETAVMPTTATAAGIAALAGLTSIAANADDEASDADQAVLQAEPAEIKTELTPEPLPNQEIEMPVKAVKTDAILDDVTEAATAGAFAELNQVVEDKAVFNERGPRIGDLVQDALRPMLKEWLDANLKGIVERAVTKEVKRISQGK